MGQYGNQPDFGTRAVAITPKGFAGGSYVGVTYQDGGDDTQIVYLTSSNLNVSTFKDGTIIPKATSDGEWDDYTVNQNVACWAYYDFDDANEKYGKLYNYYAVTTGDLYPDAYGLLDASIANDMTPDNGYNQQLGQQLKSIPTGFDGQDLTGTTLWEYSSDVTPGTDVFNFTGLPGGYYNGNSMRKQSELFMFWNNDTGNNRACVMGYDINSFLVDGFNDKHGFSVRLQVNPEDSEYIAPQPLNSAALYVGTGGDLVVTIVGSKTPVMFKKVPDASFLPIIVSNVWERGDMGITTASDIVAIY
jgi:uncharacterized protein (TIGR02145 family)